tara:strand:- start:205 stop:420 length:216 start_codon:yes stop_codon:yes gene_type:complete
MDLGECYFFDTYETPPSVSRQKYLLLRPGENHRHGKASPRRPAAWPTASTSPYTAANVEMKAEYRSRKKES